MSRTVDREVYVQVEDVLAELRERLAVIPPPDYITVAGSGEPTLNSAIGELIDGVKAMTNVPVAVLTNGSLLWKLDVSNALMRADIVVPSLDAGDERTLRLVNRPHMGIPFAQMVEGLMRFTDRFAGEVWLEVLLLAELTGTPSEVEKIAAIARRIAPARIHLNTASRPPAESFAVPLSESVKHLDAMVKVGRISTAVIDGRRYYISTDPSEVDDRKPIERLAGKSREKKSEDA